MLVFPMLGLYIYIYLLSLNYLIPGFLIGIRDINIVKLKKNHAFETKPPGHVKFSVALEMTVQYIKGDERFVRKPLFLTS